MRVSDRPFPTVDAHPFPADRPLRPVIAVEPKPGGLTWDDPLLTWDDGISVWDDQPIVGPWPDLYCDWQGFALEAGNPDDHALFDAGRIVINVDNRTGRWARYNVDGSLTEFGPGRHLAVWAIDNAGGRWWLFYGRVSRWDERAGDQIEIEAFDLFSDLAQPIGTYTPGAAGDKPGPRLTAIAAAAAFTDRTRFAVGTVTLTAQATDQAPLEEMQTVVSSDGGVLYGDADGTIVATDRLWRAGRADQVTVPAVSDNVCTVPVIVWDPVLSTNDFALADVAILENVAAVKATAVRPIPSGTRYVWADTDQQWSSLAEGNALALFRVTEQSTPRVALDTFDLYLFDPRAPDLWRSVDWRLGDVLRFVHDGATVTGPARLDVNVIVTTIAHDVTPENWIMTVGTTRAVAYIRPGLWDLTFYTWNDPAPDNVWGY